MNEQVTISNEMKKRGRGRPRGSSATSSARREPIEKRGRGRPRAVVTTTNPQRARVSALMERWCNETGLNLRQMAAGLNSIPGSSSVTFQTLSLWLGGRSIPNIDRAKSGLLLAVPGSWQARFWREVIEAISPDNVLLKTQIPV